MPLFCTAMQSTSSLRVPLPALWQAVALAAFSLLSGGLNGCGGDDAAPALTESSIKARSVNLQPADFYAAPGEPDPSAVAATEAATRPPGAAPVAGPVRIESGAQNNSTEFGQSTGFIALAGPPPADAVRSDARPVGDPTLVDSLVGQINGKPIYATRFLADLDKRLAAEAEKSRTAANPKDGWLRASGEIIAGQLKRQIEEDLLLAEARAALTPEQKQGLVFFINRLRENVASGFQGSEILAEEELRKEGLTLDTKIARDQQDALVRNLITEKIGPRVNISFRDVQRSYERNTIKYNPPPSPNSA